MSKFLEDSAAGSAGAEADERCGEAQRTEDDDGSDQPDRGNRLRHYFVAGGTFAVPRVGLEAWKTPAIVRSIESRVNGFTT